MQLQSRSFTAMIARRLNDKNADTDNRAVLPPDYKAGGDSKREELCQQDPDGDWSSIKLWATGSQERSVKRWKESFSSEEH